MSKEPPERKSSKSPSQVKRTSGRSRCSRSSSSNRSNTPSPSLRFSSDNECQTSNSNHSAPPPRLDQSKIKHIEVHNYEMESDSGSDNDLSNEAKRIMKRRKKEKEQLERLGSLVPIDTDTEADILRIAESNSTATPIPPRPKRIEMSIQTISLSQECNLDESDTRTSNLNNPYGPRTSKSVAFGKVCESSQVMSDTSGSTQSGGSSTLVDPSSPDRGHSMPDVVSSSPASYHERFKTRRRSEEQDSFKKLGKNP